MSDTPAPTKPRPVKIKTPPVHYEETQALIKKIEKTLDGPLISYWISPNGSVCGNDVFVFNELLRHLGKAKHLYLFIKSDGGNGRASLRMVHLLRQYCKRLTALVPLNCESAATMLALGADEIRMGPMAFLTPVDTSIRHDLSPIDKDNDRVSVGTNELERIIRLWDGEKTKSDENPYKTLYQYIHPLVVAAVNRAGSLSTMLCDEIMAYHISDAKKRAKISERLNGHYPSHGYPIVLKEAQSMGIKATALSPEINDDLIELSRFYSEMGQHCRTDFDESNYHDNEILNIIECTGLQVHYQVDKDWHYREKERSWYSTNERSAYKRRARDAQGAIVEQRLHIR